MRFNVAHRPGCRTYGHPLNPPLYSQVSWCFRTRLSKARSDVVLLACNSIIAVNGGMKHVIVHVSKSADCVKQQLGSVLALDGDQPVAIHAAVGDADIWPAVFWRPATPSFVTHMCQDASSP